MKIYFDAVETAARVEIGKKLVRHVFHDAEATVLEAFAPDAVEMLVFVRRRLDYDKLGPVEQHTYGGRPQQRSWYMRPSVEHASP